MPQDDMQPTQFGSHNHIEGVNTIHRTQDLIQLFEKCFFISENTRLVKGQDEPIYLPANNLCKWHRIIFANGFYASALHEIAHWCIAGTNRRQQEDYGYWYCPDGRDHIQQVKFQQVESKPQAIEWAFSLAAGFRFKMSTDNLNGVQPVRQEFAKMIYQQVFTYCQNGFPTRAEKFVRVLSAFYDQPLPQLSDFKESLNDIC
jgi:elongation factor P hydroxylase